MDSRPILEKMQKKHTHVGHIFALSGALLISPASLQATLISYWPMDDMTGDLATAEFGNDAVWQNPAVPVTWEPNGGIIGGAANLSGAVAGSNFFRVDMNNILNSRQMTISMWINPSAEGDNLGLFMTRNTPSTTPPRLIPLDGDPPGEPVTLWGINRRPDGRLNSRTTGSLDSPSDDPVIPLILVDDSVGDNNGWYHVVMTWSGDDDGNDIFPETFIYINGVLANNTTNPSTGTLVGGLWDIGNDPLNGRREFAGLIDDVAVWDQVLTSDQIIELFNGDLSPNQIDPPMDSDNDDLDDAWEMRFFGNLDEDGGDNNDGDGLTNEEEEELGTNPTLADTDVDGLNDDLEAPNNTDPLNGDTDDDGILDGAEVNGFSFNGTTIMTDPTNLDSDNDTISDGDEVNAATPTDPNDPLSPPIPDLPQDGLLALFTFDNDTATTVLDRANEDGAQNTTVAQGTPTFSEGQIGQALDLDGSTSLQFDDPFANTITELTLSTWINPRSIDGFRGVLVTRDATVRESNWGINLRDDEENGNRADYRYAGSAGVATGIQLNEWQHLVMTWNTTEVKTYLNGRLVETITTNVPSEYISGPVWTFGDDPNTVAGNDNREFNGLIDETSLWSRALSDSEISSLFRNGDQQLGIAPQEIAAVTISDFELNDDGSVSLEWTSDPTMTDTYTIWFNDNLETADPADGSIFRDWSDANDNFQSMGATSSIDIPAMSLMGMDRVFFVIERNTPAN